jgi:diaminohydroxyphosphoribosylaminopyrimidine deaminase/5-amino-6-(5-phosphoribosylamino)uracil reductase
MNDNDFMRQALELAKKGEGYVEPNPMVGCVLVQNGQIIGQGYHTQFGKAHAEVEAIQSANTDLTGATCYVTLEPCSHYGKTPPCVQAILQAGIRRVVVAMRDPNPEVNGKGIQILQKAGLTITEHVLEEEARWLNAPYLTLLEQNRPWIHAKWAMTLDGRLAAKTHDSRWISGKESRRIVHQLRSRMDAVVIGAGTAAHDDPMLTVRLDESERCGNKTPCRVILDSSGTLPPDSQLVRTARQVPVLIVTETDDMLKLQQWEQTGCEVLSLPCRETLRPLLENFALRKWTHILVEGGRQVFGTFFDSQSIDEVHTFIAPKLIGGESAIPVIGGKGLDNMSLAALLESPVIKLLEQDIYIRGRTRFCDPFSCPPNSNHCTAREELSGRTCAVGPSPKIR